MITPARTSPTLPEIKHLNERVLSPVGEYPPPTTCSEER